MVQKKTCFRIKRYDRAEEKSEFVTYHVPYTEGMTILDGLFKIVETIDGSLAFRYSCRGAVCGSCAMKINGMITLACNTQITSLLPGPITIEPLPQFKVLKDLVVDMEGFFEKYRSLQPFFSQDREHEKESLQTPEQRKEIAEALNCILCAACDAACPQTEMNKNYPGPATLNAANRFAFDSRNTEGPSKLLNLGKLDNFLGCMQIARCSKVCPKGVEPSERIDEIRAYLGDERVRPEETVVTSICGYCSTGCGLSIHKKGDQLQLTTSKEYPANKGGACPKGWAALTPLRSEDRALHPYIKNSQGKLSPANWDKALTAFTRNFKKIQDKYGRDSVAFLSTGQMPTEEMALLGCLTKFGMGIIHGDGNTRQCMATAAVAYKQAFGFDAPPYTYKDFEESDVVVFVGANPFINHPIMWERLTSNKNDPETIVIDPRRTRTAVNASKHYAIKPKSDLALFYCVAHILIEKKWIDESFINDHTTGYRKFKEHVSTFTSQKVSRITGLPVKEINDFAEMIHEGKRVSFWWCMGVNQSYIGVRTAQAIINLCLMTGNIGKPGTGPNSITGQCNAMGARLFSNTTSLYAGYDFKQESHRKKIAKALSIDPRIIPDRDSWPYDKIVEEIRSGKIKGLWVIATNPAHSWIHQSGLHKLFKKLDYLVVQDMYHTTETAARADLVLPAAGWGEKEGTFINSERRIGRVRKVSDPPGVALPDFEIFKKIAQYWRCEDVVKEWQSPEDVFQMLKKTSRGAPCDITGIENYAMLDRQGGIQWPFPEKSQVDQRERRLFENGEFYHPDGKAKFIYGEIEEAPELPDKAYPFILLTGRGTVAQFHTQTRTGKSEALRHLYPHEIYVEINPDDAAKLGIRNDDLVIVYSRRGEVRARVAADHKMRQGETFIPMHYKETNQLTLPSFDPYSHQPSYKICAVNIKHTQ